MHIHWNWAKQRPHFIAEHLSKKFNIDVYYEKSFHPERLSINVKKGTFSITELQRLPMDRVKCISSINGSYIRSKLINSIRSYDIVWITHPLIYKRLEKILPSNIKIVYDCMDDHLEYSSVIKRPGLLKEILKFEKDLVHRSNVIFASSDYLGDKIKVRHQVTNEILVVNNAIEIDLQSTYNQDNLKILESIQTKSNGFKHKIVYVGTIGDWMDFDLILETIHLFKDIVYLFFGPCDTLIPKHPQIVYFGPIPHHSVNTVLSASDVLVMPFKLTELRHSVNPVKLYEYINSCKPSISIKYSETTKFDDFVYLYTNREEYINYLKDVIENRINLKGTIEAYKEFASKNTWAKRVDSIKNHLNKL